MSIFSERTQWDLLPNRLSEISDRLKGQGVCVYDLTVSNPTRCGFYDCPDRILAPFANPANLVYGADPRGSETARKAVAQYYQGHGADIPAEHIFLTASTSEAYGFLLRLLANPSDSIIFPKPGYPLFEFLAGIHDVSWNTYALGYQDDCWRLDLSAFENALTHNPKAVILVNPNNPTGSCLRPQEARFMTDECRRKEIPLICDEVFLDYCYPGYEVRSFAGSSGFLTFVLGGVSKALALPQMKCSWIAMNGPRDLVEEASARLEMIADTFLSVNTPVQNALSDWMASRREIQCRVLSRVLSNRKFLEDEVSRRGGGAEVLKADGGWSAVVSSPCLIDDEEFFTAALLEEDHVAVYPGYFFDFEKGGYCVVSLLPEEAVFAEGVRRMLKRMAG